MVWKLPEPSHPARRVKSGMTSLAQPKTAGKQRNPFPVPVDLSNSALQRKVMFGCQTNNTAPPNTESPKPTSSRTHNRITKNCPSQFTRTRQPGSMTDAEICHKTRFIYKQKTARVMIFIPSLGRRAKLNLIQFISIQTVINAHLRFTANPTPPQSVQKKGKKKKVIPLNVNKKFTLFFLVRVYYRYPKAKNKSLKSST